MVPLEVWSLGGAVAAFGAAVWLVAARERGGASDLAALADGEGWDLQQAAPAGLVANLAELAQVGEVEEAGLYLSGPTHQGPFQLVRAGAPGQGRRGGRGTAWTFVHIRMPIASRGIWIRPNERFRPVAAAPPGATPGFSRRFSVAAVDEDELERCFGAGLCALVMRPQVPVHVGWQDHRLVVAFPVGVASARGVRTLVRYGGTVADRLAGATGAERSWRTGRPSPDAMPSPTMP